jgi:formate hydrogenlyase subunit 6/NADH:ubiquinone oxidoreductase subunit I
MFRLLLHSVVRKPATSNYPYQPAPMAEGFRGKILFNSEKCIGCKMCMRDCPARAIEIITVGEKRFDAEFNLGRCIYCAQCVDTCPKDALSSSVDFELAALKPESLKITFHAPPKKDPEPVA